jgi:hypothetical protein
VHKGKSKKSKLQIFIFYCTDRCHWLRNNRGYEFPCEISRVGEKKETNMLLTPSAGVLYRGARPFVPIDRRFAGSAEDGRRRRQPSEQRGSSMGKTDKRTTQSQ